MASFKETSGTIEECLTINPEQVLLELRKGKFALTTKASTYSAEEYTYNYIEGLFKSLEKIEKSWEECKNQAGNYIKDFQEIPEPEHVIDDTSEYLDNPEALGEIEITTNSLNIRSNAGMNSNVIGYSKLGDKVQIVGYSEDGKWIQIKTTDDKIGYISNNDKYIKIDKIFPVDDKNNIEQPKTEPKLDNYSEQQIVDINSKDNVEVNIKPQTEDLKYNNANNNLKTVKIKADSLNIRSGAGMDSDVIGWYKKGDEFDKTKILGYSEDGKWIKVQVSDDKIGYISSNDKYVQFDNSIQTQNNNNLSSLSNLSKTNLTATINTKSHNLNFRADASINSKIYGSIPRGTSVEVLNYNNNSNWVEVSYNGQRGYVYKDYIKLEGDKNDK